jgi:hypothetical protein
MRFIVPAAALLSLAACARTPAPEPVRPSPSPQPHVQRSNLMGMSVDELGARFGQPQFQVREGPGLKLQWAVPACVLDVYLYPPPSGTGAARVSYVETRRPTGDITDQAGCIAAIDAAG